MARRAHRHSKAEINATRLFEGGYNVSLGFRDSWLTLSDFVAPGDTNIYEVGCEGPRPRVLLDGSSEPWEACANRRVQCWDHTSECSGV
jgi:hypothetical protein|eukprot:COSAG01_NODE_11186_length_1988_cov_1.056644_1_plen_89_part_00